MAALRRMAIPQDNRHLLVEAGILAMLARAGRSGEVEIQREVIPTPGEGPFRMHHIGCTIFCNACFKFRTKQCRVRFK